MATNAGSVELEVKLSRGQLDRQLSQVERDMASLKDRSIKVSADFSKLSQSIKDSQTQLKQLQSDKAAIVAIGGDTKAISAEIAKVKAELSGLKGQRIELKLSKETLSRDLGQAQSQLDKLKQIRVDIDASSLKGKLAGLAAEFGKGISQGIGQGITNAGLGAVKGAVDGTIGQVGAGLKEFEDFEQALTEFDAKSDASAEQIKRLGDRAKELAAITSQSPAGVAKLGTALLTLGASADQVESSIGGITKLSDAIKEDPVLTGRVIQTGISNFGALGETADTLSDKIAKLVNTTAVGSSQGVEEFFQFFQDIGPLAKPLGEDFNTLAAGFAVLRDAGFSASTASTGLKIALLNLSAPTGEAEKALAELGQRLGTNITFDAQGKFLGLEQSLKNLKAATQDLNQQERIDFGRRIGGAEGIAALSALVGEVDGKFVKFGKSVNSSTGEVNATIETISKSLAGQGLLLEGQFTGALTEIGEAIAPIKLGFIELGADLLTSLSEGGGGMDQLRKSAEEFRSALADNPELAAALASGLKEAADAFGDAAIDTLKSLSQALSENPQLIRESIDEFGAFLKLVLDAVGAVVQLSAQIAGAVEEARKLGDVKIPVLGKAADLAKPFINPLGALADAKDAVFGKGKKASKPQKPADKGFTVAPGADLKAKTAGPIGPQLPTPKASVAEKPKGADLKAVKVDTKKQQEAQKLQKKTLLDTAKVERQKESEQKKALANQQEAQKKAEAQAKAAIESQRKAAEERSKQQLEQFDRGFATQARTIDNRASDQGFNARSKQFKSGSGDASAVTEKADRQATKERIALKQQELAGIRGLVAKGVITEKEGADRRLKIEQDLRAAREQVLQQQQQAFIKKLAAETDAAKRSSGIRIALLDKEKAANDLLLQSLDRQNQLRQAGDNLVNARSDRAQSQTGIGIARATEGVDVARQLQSQDTGANLRRVLQAQAGQLGGSDVLGALRQQQQLQAQADAQRLTALRQQQSQEALSLELGLKQQQITAKNNALEADRAVILAKQNAIEAAGNLLKAKRLGDANEVANAKQAVDLAKQGISLAEAQAKAAQDNIAAQTALARSAQDVLTIKQQTALEEAKAAAQANSRQRQRDFAGAADQQGQFIQSFQNSAVPIGRSDGQRQQIASAQAQLSGIGGNNQFQQSQRAMGVNSLDGKAFIGKLDELNKNVSELAQTASKPRSIALTTADPMADLARLTEQQTGNRLRGL